MDEQLNRLIDDYLHKKKAALEAEERMWRHLAASRSEGPEASSCSPQAERRHRPKPERKQLPGVRRLRPAQLYAIAGTAAVMLLVGLLLLFKPGRPTDYARINGKETTQPEVIEQYAAAKIQKAKLILSGCLNPLDNLHKLKKGSEISSMTLNHVQETIYNIYDNLPIKLIRHEEINDSTHVPLPADHDSERPNT